MSFNQKKPWGGFRGSHAPGRGHGGGGFHKTPFEARPRGASVSSTGSSTRVETRDFVAPIWVNPKANRTEQLEFLKKERPAAKYNVLLPFRRAKIFCPRAYQQSLYTPTLILVQELLSLAEASCASPMTEEEEQELKPVTRAKEESAPQKPVKKPPTRYFLDD